jgi:hypothetical protein
MQWIPQNVAGCQREPVGGARGDKRGAGGAENGKVAREHGMGAIGPIVE